MDDEEHRSNEEKSEFDWLSDASQERCKGCGEQDTSRDFGKTCLVHHCQRCRWQTEHHHREEARLEKSRVWITSEVTQKIAMCSLISTKLEPDVAVEYVMQTQWDQ